MRPPKPITFTALVLVLMQTTGCYSLRPVKGGLHDDPGRAQSDKTTWVTLNSGERRGVSGAWSDGEILHGTDALSARAGVQDGEVIWAPQVPVEIPMRDVTKIEERGLNGSRTLGLVMGFVVALGVVVGAGMSQSSWGSAWSGGSS